MKINIVRPILPRFQNIKSEFDRCLKSGQVTNNGKNVQKFEKNLKKYLNTKYEPVVFCNGQMAFFSLIQAWKHKLKLNNKNKIYAIVPSFTWSGTINSLVLNNIIPIFCDVDQNLLLDLKKIENRFNKLKKIRKNIKFIIPVSNYGNIIDLSNLKKFCSKNKIIPIMDSAAAFGSKFREKYSNNYGLDEIFSFHATKIMTSMEGGCAVSNDLQITNYLKYLRDFGQFEKKIGNIKLPGLNSKMQEISAIVGNYNLKNFNSNLKNRLKIIKNYNNFFQIFEKKNIFSLMKVAPNVKCSYLYYPIIIKKNIKNFKTHLKKNNINFRKYYSCVHTLEFYKNEAKSLNLGLEFTNKIKDKIIALPIFSDMSEKEMRYIFKKISQFYKEH